MPIVLSAIDMNSVEKMFNNGQVALQSSIMDELQTHEKVPSRTNSKMKKKMKDTIS